VRNEGAEQSAALFDGEDLAWEMDISADAIRRLKRLESREQLSHFEIYEELTELMSLLEVYWLGQTPERQRVTARDVRDMLRRFEALKERIQNWAQKELRKRTH
jgi:predicted ATP-dependent protease